MLFLSVTEAGEADALESVSTTARNRRTFAWRETGPDLGIWSSIRPAHGGTQLGASCDTHVGRRRPRIPFTRRNRHCQLEQFEGDFRPFACAIDQVACDI